MMSEPSKNEESRGLVRAQSSLELLSQTAAVLDKSTEETKLVAGTEATEEFVGVPTAGAQQLVLIEQTISPSVNRVTPAEQGFLIDRMRCSNLSLPDMVSGDATAPIQLGQKRSFLPAPLTFDGNYAVEHSQYSPGLFLSYSNVSNASGARLVSNENLGGSTISGSGQGGSDPIPSVLNSASFSSGNGSASSSGFLSMSNPDRYPAHAQLSMQAAFVPPRPPISQQQRSMLDSDHHEANPEDPVRENFFLRQQLAAKCATIDDLQNQVSSLQKEICQLRQLPTGKISQIPAEDMLSLMREYGSEVSDTAMPPRKTYVQKASVVRQFRRWNPNFLEFFVFKQGKWHPKLGKAGELQRRQEARRIAATNRKKQTLQNEDDNNNTIKAV